MPAVADDRAAHKGAARNGSAAPRRAAGMRVFVGHLLDHSMCKINRAFGTC